MSHRFVLGLDLGGTKIAAGVVDSAGRLRSAVRFPTPASGVRRDLAALFDAAHFAVASAGIHWEQIEAVGVGVPGAFDPVTETVWAPNLPGWKRVRSSDCSNARWVVPYSLRATAMCKLWPKRGGASAVSDEFETLSFSP